MARRPKTAKLAANDDLREYVQRRLEGEVRRPDATVTGPTTAPWKGQQAPPAGSPVGDGVERGADRQPAEDRLPR
jgi:hypothetical protein